MLRNHTTKAKFKANHQNPAKPRQINQNPPKPAKHNPDNTQRIKQPHKNKQAEQLTSQTEHSILQNTLVNTPIPITLKSTGKSPPK